MNLTNFTENLAVGLNNPDCAFYVGTVAGQLSATYLIGRIALIYFGFRFLEKLVFVGIPKLWDWVYTKAKKKWR